MNYTFSELRDMVKGRAVEAFALIGLENTPKHQHCPNPDHPDRNASCRVHGNRAICTCGFGDVIHWIGLATGLNHAQAVYWAADRLSGGFRPVAARPNIVPAPISCNSYAAKLWASSDREDSYVRQHHYAVKKGITHAFGAGRTLVTGSVVGKQEDCIVVPIREHGVGEVVAVQAINSDGRKQTFGTIGDGFLLLGDERNTSSIWHAVEGWATGCSVRKAKKCSVALISFGKGRLQKVADLAWELYRPTGIIPHPEVDQ